MAIPINREASNYINRFKQELNEVRQSVNALYVLFNNIDSELYINTTVNVEGDLIPADNNVFSIGNETNHVKDIYVDNSVIFENELRMGTVDIPDIMSVSGFGNVKYSDTKMFLNGRRKFEIKKASICKDSCIIRIGGDDPDDLIDIKQYVSVSDIVTIDDINFRRVTKIIDNTSFEIDSCFFVTLTASLIVYPSVLQIDESNFVVDNRGNVGIGCTPDMEAKLRVEGEIVADSLRLTGENSFIKGLNVEYLCGKTIPKTVNGSIDDVGDILTENGKQTLSNKSVSSNLGLMGNRVTDLANPIDNCDAANKQYADRVATGLKKLRSVRAVLIDSSGAKYKDDVIIFEPGISGNYDGVMMCDSESVLVIDRDTKRENGIYEFCAGENVLKRRPDFTHELNHTIHVYVEEGKKYGGMSFVTIGEVPLTIGIDKVEFTVFLGNGANITAGEGLRTEGKVISLNYDRDIFRIDGCGDLSFNNKFEFGKIAVGKGIVNKGSRVMNRDALIDLSLNVDNKTVVIGKYGELKMANTFPKTINANENIYYNAGLSSSRMSSADSFSICDVLFPPSSIKIRLESNKLADDDNIMNNDLEVTYYVSLIDAYGNKTDAICSNTEYYSSAFSSVMTVVEWIAPNDNMSNADCKSFCLYRKFADRLEYVVVESDSKMNKIVDTIAPRHMSKLKWKECLSLPSKNETMVEINRFGRTNSFITDGHFSIGTNNLGGAIFSVDNSFDNGISPIRVVDAGPQATIYLEKIRDSYLVDSGPLIQGKDNRGSSALRFGNHLDLITNAGRDGCVRICGDGTVNNKNDNLGRYDYRLQVLGGGIYSDGEVRSHGYYSTEDNPMGNEAAVMKAQSTGVNAAGDGVSFFVNGDRIEMHPIKNGRWNREKAKCFTIQHPVIEDKYLVHACLEGPTADVFYRGKAEFAEGSSRCIVKLPSYFNALIDPETVTISVTPIDRYREEPDRLAVSETVIDNTFAVMRYGNTNDHVTKFYWEVKAERKNVEFEPEPYKNDVVVNGIGPYTYNS